MESLDKNRLLHILLAKTKITEDGHYLWIGCTFRSGYGAVGLNWKTIKVHRVAAYIFFDLDLNDRWLFALHKNSCPYHNCWAKDCIYVGTHDDNMRDIREKDKFRCGHLKSETKMWIPSEKRWKCRLCNYTKGRVNKSK